MRDARSSVAAPHGHDRAHVGVGERSIELPKTPVVGPGEIPAAREDRSIVSKAVPLAQPPEPTERERAIERAAGGDERDGVARSQRGREEHASELSSRPKVRILRAPFHVDVRPFRIYAW